MRYRIFTEQDNDALQALDLTVQRHLDPTFDALPEREREGRISTSLPALKFYERSEHSFVAEDEGQLVGFIFAQSVWQGDKPIVLVRTLSLSPGAPVETAQGLLHATIKSAYDTAVYEVHFPLVPGLEDTARAEEAVTIGAYAVRHLGSRLETSPGVRLNLAAHPAGGGEVSGSLGGGGDA
ncbi:DUF1999 domain-containing protein [Deinococcus marmoris]|uniref:DUF1999 domain-containing protein n=1 Tax=Deinococcus marmoris TaxID=249408 RepID=A0A1U7NYK4_9DEIO|nr:DUF1999 domain-containing protein [Deinococcus marmoris]OLV17990.1 hypothetical protein BOO71_0007027 [Deinococcus marmoris]